VEERWR